jgi:hypothetical protein
MPTYSNGYIPESLLVTFAEGANTVDGTWKHQLSAATYARHLALVKRAKERTGRTLKITEGWGAYRPYSSQVVARRIYGNGAAYPGTSSHGGFWEGRQTLAMDYGNWSAVYGGDQGTWFADCRAVGLTPGMIMRSRGYPDEPWHVIDLDPWGAVPAFAGVSIPDLEVDDLPTMNEFLNTPAYTGGPTISQFFKNVDQGGIAVQVWATAVDRGLDANGHRVLISALQELADAKTVAMRLEGRDVADVTVDTAALASSLAPLLASQVSSLSNEDVARLAAALADEQARRLANG